MSVIMTPAGFLSLLAGVAVFWLLVAFFIGTDRRRRQKGGNG